MIGDMDFLALYRELGLTPGACSVAEFKLAYRRRMLQLHPDRNPDRTGDAAPEFLQHLIVVYREAIAFERRFGRLPGAEPNGRRATPASGVPVHQAGVVMPLVASRFPWKRLLFATGALLALGWIMWGVGIL